VPKQKKIGPIKHQTSSSSAPKQKKVAKKSFKQVLQVCPNKKKSAKTKVQISFHILFLGLIPGFKVSPMS
jgi:hypothetical protein